MKLGFVLLKGDLELSKEEVLSVLEYPTHELYENFLIAQTDTSLESLKNRLGQVSSIHSVLVTCPIENLDDEMKRFDWKNAYKDNFSVRVHLLKHVRGQHGGESPKESARTFAIEGISPSAMEKKLSSFVWRALENPRVKLKGATTSIHVFLLGKIAVCTCLLSQIDEGFEERRPHLRSFAHSGSMHPRLARSLINLTGAKKGDTIMDPCCGSGGLLIEIGLCGMKAEGFDVNRKMVWGSIRNMAQQKLLDYKVTCKDALTLEGKWDYVVTDLPYGLNSVVVGEGKKRLSAKKKDGIKDIGEFYFSFFKMLKEVLGKKGVVVISQLVDGKKLAKDAGLLVEKEFSQYVHGSLTRKILVLTP